MLLMIDNYDSFTFNVVQYLMELGEDVVVWRNDEISVDAIIKAAPEKIVISPGPCTPNEAGISLEVIERLAGSIPILGICLGHQLMGLASGLQTYKMRYGHRGANQPVVDLQDRTVSITSQNHGFAVAHPNDGMLAAHPTGATSPPVSNQHGSEVEVRYINANDGTVEGLDVIGKPCFTVQFHPEACPGPHDAAPLFLRFRAMVDAHLGGEN